MLPGNPSDDYLREALTATLDSDVDVVFDFKFLVLPAKRLSRGPAGFLVFLQR